MPQVSQEEPTATSAFQSTEESQPDHTATVLSTETLQLAPPEMLKVRPEQIRREALCFDDGFVSVQDLAIPPYLGLLLVEGQVSVSEAEEPYPMFIYQPATGLPGKLLSLKLDKTLHSIPLPNQAGTLFYYLQYDKGQPERTLVVQSTDGQMRKTVLEREYPFGYPSWIDDHHILWTDIPDPENYWSFGERPDSWEYVPTHLINVYTLETQELPPIHFPKKDGQYTVQNFIHSATGNYAFLQHAYKDQVSYEIYSYVTQTSQPVFTWLPDRFLQELWDARKNITANNWLYFIAVDDNVFSIVSGVSMNQVLSGSDALAGHVYEVTFPEEIAPSFIPYYFETGDAFLYTHENRLGEDILEPVPQHLYRFDIETQTVYDYCLDLQKWRGTMYISPGEEFAAMTVYENHMTGEGKKDTILINLATGERAILPDYQVFGWVTVNQ